MIYEWMNELLRQRAPESHEDYENPFGDKARSKRPVQESNEGTKGFFRDPEHVEKERAKKYEDKSDTWRKRNNWEGEDRELKYLKFSKRILEIKTLFN